MEKEWCVSVTTERCRCCSEADASSLSVVVAERFEDATTESSVALKDGKEVSNVTAVSEEGVVATDVVAVVVTVVVGAELVDSSTKGGDDENGGVNTEDGAADG